MPRPITTSARRSSSCARIDEARTEYIRALERDAYPFRELPQLDRELTGIARSEGVPLID
jgi:hypothetical protein